MPLINDKRTLAAWCRYDWANSVYSLVITSTIFPIYYGSAVGEAFPDGLRIGPLTVPVTAAYSWTLSLSFLLIVVLSPILSGIADFAGRKLSFMKFFVLLGSISCIGLGFFKGDMPALGLTLAGLASLSFAGSLVFYNSFLPVIATPDRFDSLSSRGFIQGYIGSVILLVVCLALVMKGDALGINAGQASRLSFILTGLWWLGFSILPFRRLPKEVHNPIHRGLLATGWQKIKAVLTRLHDMPDLKKFIRSYFFFNMAVQTVMLLAASFGERELHLDASILIGAILAIQLVAIAGAWLFTRLSRSRGNVYSLALMIVIWLAICAGALLIQPRAPAQFLALAAVVGLVMGGIQSLSRSTYGKLLPQTENHATWFSLFDVTDKLGVVFGTLIFGLAEILTGELRPAIWPLIVFFIIGFLLLLPISKAAALQPAKPGA